MKSEKPLPCPWCGKEPAVDVDGYWALITCRTTDCPVHPNIAHANETLEGVVAAWNMRAPEENCDKEG